jgi:glutamyl-tRNA synthetase
MGGGARGRFAPSPTGPLHVGNLRTALLAWLFARSAGAEFLMRVEDLDAGRVRPGLEEAHLAAHEADDLVYECFCTRAEIREAASAPHGPLPEGAYPGTCAQLTAAERAERRAGGRPPALRLRAGAAEVEVVDRLRGPVGAVVDDFVVRRNDGAPAYNLAVVVDDAAQAIGEVVRGDDLLDSTPRQVLLARRLGVPAPAFAHVPLVLGPDGARLAKRHGAVTLADRRALGESPDDVRGRLAVTLGLAEPGEAPAPAELLARFDPARLPAGPTVWTG